MRVNIFAVILLCLIPAAVAGAEHQHDTKVTKHYEDSKFGVTDKKLFSVEMVISGKEPVTGVNSIDLIIHDRQDKDVTGAKISVTPWMPDMGHGVFEKPVVSEKGGGLYRAENIILIMSGHWQLWIDITKDTLQDSVVFDFPDVKTGKGHDHGTMKTSAPAEIHLSKTRLSENKTFTVTYESDVEPLPINKIHSWKIKIETADKKPVTGARIDVDGDMPEHGHGMPTNPEVTEELGNGSYRVEGMKFSMPGWWVIKFYIKTPDRSESVSFNLLLEE